MSRSDRRPAFSQSAPSISSIQPSNSLQKKTSSFLNFDFLILFFFHLLLLTTPLFFTWINEELFEFNKLILVYAYTLIIGSLWVAKMIYHQKVIFKKTPFDIPILLFLLSQFLSTLFSMDVHTSLFGYYTRFHGGLFSYLSYSVLFFAAVSNLKRKDLSGLFFTTFLSALITSWIGIFEHFGHSLSCLLINIDRSSQSGELQLSGSNLSSWFTTSCWIQDVQNRVFSTFGQPNWLAAYAVMLIPLGCVLSVTDYLQGNLAKLSRFNRFFYFFTTLSLFATLLFTKSRSGILGLGIGMSLFLVGCGWVALRRKSIRPKVVGTTAVVVCLVMLVGIFGTPYTPSLESWNKFRSTSQAVIETIEPTATNRLETGGTESGDIRKIVWTGAIKVWQRHWLLGSGVETFAYSYYKDRPMAHNLVSEWDFLYNKAHNEFLNFLATTGIVGFTAYMLLLIAFIGIPLAALVPSHLPERLAKFIHLPSETSELALVSSALSGGLVALSVSNFFGFSTVMVTALMFLYPAFWILWAANSEKEDVSSSPNPGFTPTQWVSFSLLGIVAFALLYFVYTLWYSDKFFSIGKANVHAGQIGPGVGQLEKAVLLNPSEPFFTDELSIAYARAAYSFATTKEATAAAYYAQKALTLSDKTLEMNNVHLNFYKTRIRLLMLLGQLNPTFLLQAKNTLLQAIELSPTDPQLVYNLGVIELGTNPEEGMKLIQKSIQMKPNYEMPRMGLAEEYERQGKIEEAKEQYSYILENIQPNNEVAKEKLNELSKPATSSAVKSKTK
jgi:putative inorganic carbon (HCO3(-)) transporter